MDGMDLVFETSHDARLEDMGLSPCIHTWQCLRIGF